MFEKDYKNYLRHILDECHYIREVVPDGMTKNEMLENVMLRKSLERSLEIIGEATKRIPGDIKYQWRSIEWKNMAGMRDRIIHDYEGINYSIVWMVCTQEIPTLIPQIEAILNEEQTND